MFSQGTLRAQVTLLIRCLPAVMRVPGFALKGGTALNLFHHDLPRLSVDIDLTFLPITDRDEALDSIRTGLAEIAEEIRRTIPGSRIQAGSDAVPKLFVELDDARIKVEPNTVIRGSLLQPEARDLCPTAQEEFELFARAQCLATEELYAGKLCAALDRQHPRDLFDIKMLHDAGEIPDAVRRAFVAYVAAHRRPMAELLAPRPVSIEDTYAHQFVGMTAEPITLKELLTARERLFRWVSTALSEKERQFLLSLKLGKPDWSLMPFERLRSWPAVLWKLHNIEQMTRPARQAAISRLRKVLDL